MEEIIKMVGEYYLILFVGVFFAGYSLGRLAGRIEVSLTFQQNMPAIISALKKVQQLAELRGEDASKLSTQEIVIRIQKQLDIKNVED